MQAAVPLLLREGGVNSVFGPKGTEIPPANDAGRCRTEWCQDEPLARRCRNVVAGAGVAPVPLRRRVYKDEVFEAPEGALLNVEPDEVF